MFCFLVNSSLVKQEACRHTVILPQEWVFSVFTFLRLISSRKSVFHLAEKLLSYLDSD